MARDIRKKTYTNKKKIYKFPVNLGAAKKFHWNKPLSFWPTESIKKYADLVHNNANGKLDSTDDSNDDVDDLNVTTDSNSSSSDGDYNCIPYCNDCSEPECPEGQKKIMVGSDYQAVVPEGLSPYIDDLPYKNEDKLIWDPNSPDKDIKDLL